MFYFKPQTLFLLAILFFIGFLPTLAVSPAVGGFLNDYFVCPPYEAPVGNPEMDMFYGSTALLNGDVTPTVGEGTDFGSAGCITPVTRRFTIKNNGSDTLRITLPVAVGGTNPGDFSVTLSPATKVKVGDSTHVEVTFTPSASGTRSATISITNDDTNENPYTFSIQGTGSLPEINVQGSSTSISDGDTSPDSGDDTDFGNVGICSGTNPNTFTIQNNGNATLSVSDIQITGTHALDFTLSGFTPTVNVGAAGNTTFTVTFNPSASGIRDAIVTITNTDCDEGTYNFEIQGTGVDPELALTGNGNAIADGSTTPATNNETDFGSVSVCSGNIEKSFLITNSGSASSTIGTPTISGANAADFSVQSNPGASVNGSGGTTSFTIRFDPSASGTRTATVSFANQDCDENPYNFAIQGTGNAPEIDVTGGTPATSIADNDITPSSVDGTDFGNVNVCSPNFLDKTYTITNTGNISSSISSISIGGTHSGDFSVQTSPSGSVAATTGSTTFTIRFNPSASGTRSATISFDTDDCEEDPYNFSIQGTGIQPEVNVQGNGTSIGDNDGSPSSSDSTHFGDQSTCSGTLTRTFTIQNTGTDVLNITSMPALSGANASDFTIVTMPSATISAGGSSTFTVRFDPSANGNRNAEITFVNDDCSGSEGTYNFSIRGTGVDPEIQMLDATGLVNIPDGNATTSLTDGTEFANTLVCSGSSTRTFTIKNTDNNAVLSVGAITFSGTNASDFAVTTLPSGSVAANNATTTFVVTFSPSGSGTRTATINIANGDCDENPFNFALEGFGLDPETDIKGNGVYITDGDVTPTETDHTDFDTTIACGATIDRVFTIENNGNTPLTISSTTVSPTTNFAIQAAPSGSVSAGGSTTFTVRYTPSTLAAGSHTATVTVTSADCNESAYTFDVKGTTLGETTPPTALCQNYTAYLNAVGAVTVPGSALNNGSTDNCTDPGNLIFSSGGSFDCSDVGTPQSVIISVTDGFGNSANCASSDITVLDSISPVATCQNLTVYLDATGSETIADVQLDNGSSDFCGIASYSASKTTFTCTDVGANNVVLTVLDVNGNDRQCTSVVTVVDTISPNPVCQNITVYLNSGGTTTTTAGAVDGGSADACGIATRVLSTTSFSCVDLGPNSALLTITDVNGNDRSCTTTITVADTTRPDAICQNITVQLDGTGFAAISPSQLDNSSTDNCTIGTLVLSNSQFDCSDVGPNNITLTVPDQSSNADSCVAVVTVEDNIDPVANCQDIFIELDTVTGSATILPSQINNNSTDVCGIASMTLDSTFFDCDNIADTNIVILTVTDNNGNQDTCTALVNIVDNTSPTAVCANDTVFIDTAGNAVVNASVISGGSADACGAVGLTISQANFDCTDLGSNLVTVTVDDGNGNTSTCQASILVQDTIPPTARCVNVVITLNTTGNLTINPFFVDDNSIDNCSIQSRSISRTSFNCSDVNLVAPVILTVTDPSGLQDTCHATVTTRDYTLPTVTCNNLNLTLDAGGNASTTLSAILGSATDACGIATMTISDSTFNCSNVGLNEVILTVIDNANNIRRCTSQVMVNETQLPDAVCQNVTVNLDSNGLGSIVVADINNGSSDNCAIDTMSISATDFDCSDVGQTTVSLTVGDASGNIDSCTSTVTIVDNMIPWITCRDTTVNLPTGDSVSLALVLLMDDVGDNCGIDTVTMSQSTFDCSNFGLNTVTITATDVNGLTGSCISQVNITGSSLAGGAAVTSDFCGYAVSCNGATDGMAIATASGGCPPHSFAWSNGSTNDTIINLTAGTYIVTITDGGGVTLLDTVVIDQPNALAVNVVSMQQTCEGDSTGSIDVSVSGGNLCSGGYLYNWSTGDTVQDISNLVGGTYTLTLTDPMGCQITEPVVLNNFPTPSPVINQLDSFLTCTPSFATYQWYMNGDTIPGATLQTFTADTNGQYHVSVVSADGCEGVSTPVTVTFTIIGVEPESAEEFSLTLFPNPNQGGFQLQVSKPIEHPLQIQVTDVLGRVLYMETLPNLIDNRRFELTNAAAGTYLVTLSSKKFKPLTLRMIVE